MRVLMCGGSSCGKSAFAERLAASLAKERVYVATMRAWGADAKMRIERHRRQRQGLSFETLECPDSLAGVPATTGVVLVDDLGNLCANALFGEDAQPSDVREAKVRLLDEFCSLCERAAHVVVVHVEAGCAGRYQDPGTMSWLTLNGSVAAGLAARFDCVIEVTSGLPCVLKGELPCP